MSSERRKRLVKILELISTRSLHTQEELSEALAGEGWEVTQSSVSRDIAALGLVKIDGVYRRAPSEAAERGDPDERRIAESLLAVSASGDAMLVLHTPPGEASRVSAALDRLAWSDVVGTLAGDDTIFVALPDRAAQRRVLRQLTALAPPSPTDGTG